MCCSVLAVSNHHAEERERERERERVRKDSKCVVAKRELWGRSERHFIILLEGSQALPFCPSGKGSMPVKTLKE
jgi:hypothetical protein